MNPSFWRGKRVFLTGHTGFKGGWLSFLLQTVGAQLSGYALRPPTEPNLFETAAIGRGLKSIIADVRDSNTLTKELRAAAPDIVIHMAAQPLVRHSYVSPIDTYATNIMGTAHLLEAVRQSPGVRVVVVVTSDKCYENKEWLWGYRETDSMGGFDPYSSSKGCAELVTAAYRRSFFNPATYSDHGVGLASVRAGNVIGGGDWAEDRLVPDIVRALIAHRPVLIRNPDSIRPWQHVLDPLGGYLELAEKLWADGSSYAQGWNFGPRDEDAMPVSDVVERLIELWGGGGKWLRDSNQHPHEAVSLKLDCSKAYAKLGWRPTWNLDLALRHTAEWYRVFSVNDDVRPVMERQVQRYIGAAL